MKSSLHQSLPPLTFQLLTDNLTRLATFDCFHYIRWVKKKIIAILVVLGSASFLGWALSASFVLETYCIRRSRIHRFNHLSSDGSAAWALVTGASGGIGYEIVRELARRGFNVILHGRDEQGLLTAMVRIHEEFPVPKFKILVADPTVLGSKDFWYRKSYGTGSWSVNLTLGLGRLCRRKSQGNHLESIIEENEKTIPKNINVDALYPIQLFRTLLPTLIDNGPSLLMNITSLSDKGIPLKIETPASRTFLSRMTESSALEMKLEGYDVEALCVQVSRHMDQTDSSLAKAIIARAGNRRSVVVGHWYQFLYKGLIDLLPGWLWDWCMIHCIRGKRDNEFKGS